MRFRIEDTRGRCLRAALLAAGLLGLLLAPSALAVPPETTIDSGPADPTNNTTPTFTFSSPSVDPVTLECRLDGVDDDPYTDCSDGSYTTPTLDEGEHTFEVRAVDVATSEPGTPASENFNVDITEPATTIDDGPADPTGDNAPTFAFHAVDASMVTFECRIDGVPAVFAPCSGPGATHTTTDPLADGPHTFEVRGVDAASNVGDPVSLDFTVDTAAPATTIDSGPAGPTADFTPTFGFSTFPNDPNATFQCRVDANPFGACSGPGANHTAGPLSDGPHTFRVRAVDEVANIGVAASRSFTVDTIGPNTTIDSGPSGTTADDTPTFGFSSDPNATFQCRVDSDPFAACSGPGATHTAGPLADGPHSFHVRAVDAAANFDPSPASRSFTVDTSGPPDTTGPDTTITKSPKRKVKTKGKKVAVKVAFNSEAGASFTCRLDKGRYEPCESPYRIKAKAKGGRGAKHTISVRATDESGNPGTTATIGFRVVRSPRLRSAVARRTVATALRRHGFARRVVKALRVSCRRRGRSAFACSFSAGFRGYRLRGRGQVALRGGISYRFRVKAQGVRFTLTDENEAGR